MTQQTPMITTNKANLPSAVQTGAVETAQPLTNALCYLVGYFQSQFITPINIEGKKYNAPVQGTS